MKKYAIGAIVLVAGFSTSALAGAPSQFLVVPDSTNDVIVTFSPFDGSLISSSFIDLNTMDPGTPKHAMQVGNEIWISDQIRDRIDRFSLTGGYLSSIGGQVAGGGLDNIKGMAVVGNEVWVTNAGSNNNAPGNAIVRIDIASGAINGSNATDGSLFDLVNYQGRVLASNIGNENLEYYDTAGNFINTFHASDGATSIDFPQQLFVTDEGTVLAAGFSPPSGVYEFGPDGTSMGVVAGADGGARGVYQLGNGNIMWTNGSGVWVTDTGSGQETLVYSGGGAQYIDLVVIPTPGAAGLLALAGVAAIRRRR